MTTNNGSESARAKSTQPDDAVTLLKNDHRAVEQLFAKYESASEGEKSKIAKQICQELIIHTLIEEEIFYPACREHMDDESALDEAQVEHDGAKALIIELLDGAPSDDFYAAKVKVLSEQIKHHVAEEEKRSEGIFAKAKAAGVAMDDIAEKLQARKAELKRFAEQGRLERPQPRSFTSQTRMEDHMPQYRERDEYGRFTEDDRRYASQRYGRGRSRYEDEDYGRRGDGARGRERDEYGRFMSEEEDDDYRRSRGRAMPERDEYGRFMSEEEEDYGPRRPRRRAMPERDEFGRFMSDEDEYRGRSRAQGARAGGGRYREEDEGRGHGRGGWFGDPRGHSEASRRGWERSEHEGSGWYGDPQGHAEASRRGWESRGYRGPSRYEDDERRYSRARYEEDEDRRGRGRGGWFGDPEGHSEASRRGWRNRQ
jgi:hemerythrin superfamily protein